MFKAEEQNGNYIITIGVPCSEDPRAFVLRQPLTYTFSVAEITNLAALEEKIKTMQREFDELPEDAREMLRRETETTQAFETSKYQNVFEAGLPLKHTKIVEPEGELRTRIVHDANFKIEHPAHLLMRNVALARRQVLAGNVNSPITQQEVLAAHGILYQGYNQMCECERHLQFGHVLTGMYKKSNCGGKNFRTANWSVTDKFMNGWEGFMASDVAMKMRPSLLALFGAQSFVDIHPFDDGNGRNAGVIQEASFSRYGNGEFDLRGVVAVCDSEHKAAITQALYLVRADNGGNVAPGRFLNLLAGLLIQSVDKAIENIKKAKEVGSSVGSICFIELNSANGLLYYPTQTEPSTSKTWVR